MSAAGYDFDKGVQLLGKNSLWVARQHGHSVRTMLEIYAAWADGAVESDVEAVRNSMGLASSVQAAPPSRRFSIWHWIWHQKRSACT